MPTTNQKNLNAWESDVNRIWWRGINFFFFFKANDRELDQKEATNDVRCVERRISMNHHCDINPHLMMRHYFKFLLAFNTVVLEHGFCWVTRCLLSIKMVSILLTQHQSRTNLSLKHPNTQVLKQWNIETERVNMKKKNCTFLSIASGWWSQTLSVSTFQHLYICLGVFKDKWVQL